MWYVLVSDDSGHKYIIPEDKKDEWYNRLNDDEYFEPEEWAIRIEGKFKFKEFSL